MIRPDFDLHRVAPKHSPREGFTLGCRITSNAVGYRLAAMSLGRSSEKVSLRREEVLVPALRSCERTNFSQPLVLDGSRKLLPGVSLRLFGAYRAADDPSA
jgi:hypothetical protein